MNPEPRQGPRRRRPITVADCERLQTHWFVAGARHNGGEVWQEGSLDWTWHPYSRHAMLLFPAEIPAEALGRALRHVAELGAQTVGAWLGPEVDPAALADAGFERGWSPWWMAAPMASIGPAVDGRVHLEEETPEYTDPETQALLALSRVRPQDTWHAVARVGRRLAGHGWSHLDGDVAGVFNFAVWPEFQRRGLGTGIVRAVCAAAAAAGAEHAVLNATPEGERLYSTVGFSRIGDGITWWLHR